MAKHFSNCGLMMTSLVLLAIFLTSCVKSTYKNAIPADAPIVVELNIKNVGIKSDFPALKDDIADLIIELDPDDRMLKKIANALRKPEELGLNLLNPMYFFLTNPTDDVFFLASVRQQDNVCRRLCSFADEIEVNEEGLLSWLIVDDRLAGVITPTTLIIGSADSKVVYRNMLDNSISFFSTKEGKFFAKHTGDLTATINARTMSRNVQNQLRSEVEDEIIGQWYMNDIQTDELWERLFETQAVANLTFKSGEIALKVVTDSPESKDDADLFNVKISKETLKMIPNRNLFGLVALGLNGPEICKQVEKVITNTDHFFNTREEKQFYNQSKQILRKTNGTAAVALYGEDLNEDPEFLGILPVPYDETRSLLENFEDNLPSGIGIDGDNQSVSVSNIRNYSHGEVRMSFEQSSRATSSYAYAYLDAEPLVDMAFAAMTRYMDADEVRLFKSWRKLADFADFAEITVEKKNEATLRLLLHNDAKNALALVLTQGIRIGHEYIEYENARRASYQNDYNYDPEISEEVAWEAQEEVVEVTD